MDDTIAAISTALAEGGIGIVRVSGPCAIQVVDEFFSSARKVKLAKSASHRIYYGWIKNRDDTVIDEVLVSVMREPYTYTREDIVEINCHGGLKPQRDILELILDNDNVRLAEPGEFTKRAFLNGRIDLAQAESVIDIIRSKTERALHVSVDNLRGRLSEKIEELRGSLLRLRGKIEVSIDYPEYDEPVTTRNEIDKELIRIHQEISILLESSKSGRILREGLKTVIVGKPNVGKSSLLNALLGIERAIVTEIPGTTRDTVEEMLSIGGIPLNIIDTAGIRESGDLVEKIGIERSEKALRDADLVLFVLDSSRQLDEEDRKIREYIGERETIVILNKVDQPAIIEESFVKQELGFDNVVSLTAITGVGLNHLERVIKNMFWLGKISTDDEVIVTNVRHIDLLKRAEVSLCAALKALDDDMPIDILAIDIEAAWHGLGMIIGQAVDENLIDHIFAEFCLGK